MRLYHFFIFLSLILLTACEDENTEAVNTLGSEVDLSMSEFIDEGDRVLTFKFLTRKDYPCINYRIQHELNLTGNKLTIRLEKIKKAELCLDAIGPASAFIDIRNLSPKTYDFQIQLGASIIREGKLHVSKEAYQVEMEEHEGIHLTDKKINRIPAHAIWGTIKYEDTEANKDLLDYFSQSSGPFGAREVRWSEGDYGYFRIGADGKIKQPTQVSELMEEKHFAFEFEGDERDIRAMIQKLKSTYPDAQIRLFTSQGREFR
jgi:hypothetical protein